MTVVLVPDGVLGIEQTWCAFEIAGKKGNLFGTVSELRTPRIRRQVLTGRTGHKNAAAQEHCGHRPNKVKFVHLTNVSRRKREW